MGAPGSGAGGLPKVQLRSADGSVAELYLHGAQLTSWIPASDGIERIFLSSRSEFRDGTAIRGGVPVIFPQFATEGPLPRHGFARTAQWTLISVDCGGEVASTSLTFSDSAQTRAIWPHAFTAMLTARLATDRLALTLSVENKGDAPLRFTAALHSYLRVADIDATEIRGLAGTRFRESATPGALRTDHAPILRVKGEIDRVYVNAPHRLSLREVGRSMAIETVGFPDVIVWNPGGKATALADLESGGERAMLCVEAGAVQEPVVLAPGEQWAGTQSFAAQPGD